MIQQVDAVYENGVLRPLGPVCLTESQRVRILIAGSERGNAMRDVELLEMARAEVAGMTVRPTLLDVQHALSVIPGNLTEDFIAEREDR